MVAVFKKIKKREQKESVFFSVLLLILFFGMIGFLIFSNVRINQRRAELLGKIDSLKKEIQALEEQNASLQTGISKTQTEDYRKETLYEQGYVEKGEQQVVVLPPQEEKEDTGQKEKNFWQTLLGKLGF